jgi:hypothetical protein
MNAAKPASAAGENSLHAKVDVEAETGNVAAPTGGHAAKAETGNVAAQTGGDAERIRSSLAQHVSNSDDELGNLISELQEVREFLRSEAERLQREFANYNEMQQSASAAADIINQTLGPWKGNLMGERHNSRAKPLVFGSRGKVKRWPAD